MEYIAAYDFGTSGVKAVIVDYDGKLIASSERGYPLLCPAHGFAEQNPEDYWQAVCGATQEVVKTSGIPKENVMGLAFSTQGMGSSLLPPTAVSSLTPSLGWTAVPVTRQTGSTRRSAKCISMRMTWSPNCCGSRRMIRNSMKTPLISWTAPVS